MLHVVASIWLLDAQSDVDYGKAIEINQEHIHNTKIKFHYPR